MEGDTESEVRAGGAEERDAANAGPPPPRRGATPAEVIATLAIVGAFAAIAIARPVIRRLSPHPPKERCAAMLDRYAEHQARAANRIPASPRLSPDAPEAARCARELTVDEVECAMRANDADQLERCLP